MKKVLFGLFIFTSCIIFGQKVKFKKSVVLIDDKEWLSYEDENGYGTVSLFSKAKKELVFMKYIQQNYSRQIFAEGVPNYYIVKFIGTDKTVEIRDTPWEIAKLIYKANIINDDFSFNKENLDVFVMKYGNDFSKSAANHSQQTVIIQDSRPRNGFNISVGR
ncbi:hypothetical protein [Chryseobacterium mucoviscidosis]|uniref:Uncharacterized protein n=1 Tax=Chryseobacterium mucoviscidosis TaxID=1945581 RepID=A0A202BYU0_9FLAO|nr:hypothetical protein [Chryseobacterium mucoviscidosis]OVE56636.1 hypothetical protein B0E34_14015 [Chryseobacterium mucoviscidosis]